MFLNTLLFYFFSSFLLLSSLFLILSRNPVFSVLFLILAFFNAAGLLFLIIFELLPISFIIIYVGAVAVLFLFVLMMLNIKLAELLDTGSNFLPITILFMALFFIEFFVILLFDFESLELLNSNAIFLLSDFINPQKININFPSYIGAPSNILNISHALFSKYFFEFLGSGLVLLLAMVGTITLTLQKRFINKYQNVYYQILRDHKRSIVPFH